MKKITVFMENNEKDLYLDVCINRLNRSTMTLKNAAVYWKYKNVISGINDFILYGSNSNVNQKIMFGEGYWTFNMIKDKLKPYGVTLTRIYNNNTCKINSTTYVLNLDKFALLLGFPERQMIKIQLLNSTVTYFRNIDSRVVIKNGCFNRLSFDVDTNINKKVDMNLLLQLCID